MEANYIRKVSDEFGISLSNVVPRIYDLNKRICLVVSHVTKDIEKLLTDLCKYKQYLKKKTFLIAEVRIWKLKHDHFIENILSVISFS